MVELKLFLRIILTLLVLYVVLNRLVSIRKGYNGLKL